MDSWILILYFGLSSNTNFITQNFFQLWPVGSFSFDIPWFTGVGFIYFYIISLTFWQYKVFQASLCISYSVLESAISPRSPGSFYWTIEPKLGVFIATEMSLLLGPLR